MLKYEVVMFWSDEDDVFVAFSPELVGCMAHGDTREAALENIQEAMEHWLDISRETGKPIPQPAGPAHGVLALCSRSGRKPGGRLTTDQFG